MGSGHGEGVGEVTDWLFFNFKSCQVFHTLVIIRTQASMPLPTTHLTIMSLDCNWLFGFRINSHMTTDSDTEVPPQYTNKQRKPKSAS